MARQLFDLSHTVEAGMITYKGLPAPLICDYLSREKSRELYADGTEFHIGRIDMVANTGTYLDSPFHRYADGKDLADLPLESLADVPAVVVHAGGPEIGPDLLDGLQLKGKAVLFRTDWSDHWGEEAYFSGHPYLTEQTALRLRDSGARIVGIDSLNIDDTSRGQRPVHSTLLGAEIPIVEHMTGLEQLPREGGRFTAVPVKVRDFGTFPVRAFAVVD